MHRRYKTDLLCHSVYKTTRNLPFEAWKQIKWDYFYCQSNNDIFSIAILSTLLEK